MNKGLQGLRFWAITLIVASHCGLLSQGGVGNAIFFALSGFLISSPFREVNAEFKVNSILNYYAKRALRIIPTFWICLIFFTFVLPVFKYDDFISDDSLVLNMFFVKCRGHLWFLQQEVLYYLIAPFFLIIISYYEKRIGNSVKWLVLFFVINIIAFFINKYFGAEVFYLLGNGAHQNFRLGYFLVGLSFSYLYRWIKSKKINDSNLMSIIASLAVILFIAFTIISSEPILKRIDDKYSRYFIGWEHPIVLVYISSIVIMLISLSPNSFMSEKLSLFSDIGDISYPMYIIHFFIINAFYTFTSKPLCVFVAVYIVSLCCSKLIRRYIELPLSYQALKTRFHMNDSITNT